MMCSIPTGVAPAYEAESEAGISPQALRRCASALPTISATLGGGKAAGLALRFAGGGSGDAAFLIDVVDGGDEVLLTLGPFEEAEVIATWRAMGASSGLPLMIARADGLIESPYPQVGRLQLGAIRIRRRRGFLSERRPRFLTRRRTGRLPLRPRVHRGEPEIAGGGGA